MLKSGIRFDLLFFDVQCKLKAQLATSYFGWLWWIIEPLATILSYYFVFGFLLRSGGDDYIYQLVIGVVIWGWFSTAVIQSSLSIQRSSSLILQLRINKLFFPLSDVLQVGFRQVIVVFILFILLAALGFSTGSWIWIPVLLLELLLLILAVSIWLAAIVPFFPDAFHLSNMAMRLLMFCSGVFYTLDMISIDNRSLFLANPIANVIHQFRTVLLSELSPSISSVLIIIFFSVFSIAGAVLFLKRYDQVYPRLVVQ